MAALLKPQAQIQVRRIKITTMSLRLGFGFRYGAATRTPGRMRGRSVFPGTLVPGIGPGISGRVHRSHKRLMICHT